MTSSTCCDNSDRFLADIAVGADDSIFVRRSSPEDLVNLASDLADHRRRYAVIGLPRLATLLQCTLHCLSAPAKLAMTLSEIILASAIDLRPGLPLRCPLCRCRLIEGANF